MSDRLELAQVFLATVARFLVQVSPQVTSELARWRSLASEIPNSPLREAAQEALRKRGNIDGAALFATLASSTHRRQTVRALVAFQAAYNYLDALSELPSENPRANGEMLHRALVSALDPGAPYADYYEYSSEHDDGGYLTAMLGECRDAIASLPSYRVAAPAARAAAARIVDFQALNLSEADGGHELLARWAADALPEPRGLQWWETAAAAGSSLSVHALIAAAADPSTGSREVEEIEEAYFPWIGSLHSLLDSLVDRHEDLVSGRPSLLGYYDSPAGVALQLGSLARRARDVAERLRSPLAHRVILTAMCSYYLSAPESYTAEAQTVAPVLTKALGLPLNAAISLFRAKRLLHAFMRRTYR